MGAIHLHSRPLLLISREAAIRAKDDSVTAGSRPTDAILAIVMAAAAAEAFINEFAALVPRLYDLIDDPPIALATCTEVLLDLEESRVPVTTKYLVASQALAGKSFNTGAAPYQDFKLLIDLRNSIMHIKPAFSGESNLGQRCADVLGQRGIAIAHTGQGSLSWFHRLMTPGVAEWAHDAALKMILAFMARVPSPTDYDPLMEHRRSFLDHASASV
jgi:hypothetical protein